jgi:hypothetical protein
MAPHHPPPPEKEKHATQRGQERKTSQGWFHIQSLLASKSMAGKGQNERGSCLDSATESGFGKGDLERPIYRGDFITSYNEGHTKCASMLGD